MNRFDRVRLVAVGIVAPLLILIAGVGAVAAALPELPDPMAVHWGPSGVPDGFGSPWILIAATIIIVLMSTGVAVAVIRSIYRERMMISRHKVLLALSPVLAVLLTVLTSGAVLMQRGLADPATAPSVLPALLASLGGAAIAAVVAWVALPKATPYEPSTSENLPTLELTDTENAVWIGRVSPSPWVGGSIVGLLGVATIVGGAAMWATASLTSFALYLIVMLLLVVLVTAMLFWNVTVSQTGFSAVSVIGLPRFSYPLSQITSARSADLDPLKEFGGWGMRGWGSGRFGIVTRRGQSIEVLRSNGKAVVVTVDGAREGAALLNGLIARARPRPK